MSKPDRKRPPTSADVARKVGVSRATVSYVLNGLPNSRISPETQESVRAAASALSYIPHAMARSLRTGHTNTVLIPRSSYPLGATLNQFYDELSTHLRKLGYTPLVHMDTTSQGLEVARTWAALRPIGLLVLESRVTAQSIKLLRTAGVQGIVVIAHQPSSLAPTLLADHSELGACAARHLISRGHTQLAVLVPRDPHLRDLGQARLRGVQREADLAHANVTMSDLGFDACEARDLALQLRGETDITGIVAFNDMYALLLIKALQDISVRVPQDIAIIGIDNLDVCNLVRPGLTSVQSITAQPLETFIEFFHALMQGQPTTQVQVPLFSPSVEIRESA